MLPIGSLVDGKYKILNKIGQGGMSVVYLSMNERANKQWAIKEIRKDGIDNYEVVRQGLIAEVEMLKRLHHANLPSIIDVIDNNDTFLIVMDYIEGNPLSKALRDHGALPQANVVKWGKQLCGVLGYLHSRVPPIIYRDLKPANIMLQPDGNIMVIDFGTAREFKEGRADDTVALGTQGYAAPEQFGLHQTDARTDIYNLGATLYHLVTGHNPCDPPYVMYPIRQWNPALSSGLESIIYKCTQRDPNMRYQSAAELLYDLEHYHQLDIEYRKARAQKTRMFFVSVALTLVSVLGMVGFAIGENIQRDNSYSAQLQKANNEYGSGIQAAGDYLIAAATLDPARPEAYNDLLSFIKQDQQIDDNDDNLIRRILNEVSAGGQSTNLDSFKENDPVEYANFAYNLGIAYFFTYSGGETAGAAKAQVYLNDAKDSPTLDAQKKDIASKLAFISERYENIFKNNDSKGTLLDEEAYGPQQFWSDLTSLISEDSINSAGNSYIALYLYRYVGAVVFANYDAMLAAGVSASQLNSGLDRAQAGLRSVDATSASERELVESGMKSVSDARLVISSAVSHTAQGGAA